MRLSVRAFIPARRNKVHRAGTSSPRVSSNIAKFPAGQGVLIPVADRKEDVMKHVSNVALAGLFGVITGVSAPAVHAQTSAPNDAQIAGIVVAADSVDIDAGKLAKSKTHNKEVKQFAQQMIADHTGVNKQASALAKKLKLKPEDSDASKSLKDNGKATMDKLKGLKGADFDKAYVDNEVTYHEAVLDTIDKTLIPNAKKAELKSLVEKVRPAIDAHLQHAKQIQSKLKSG
jgi:putative membrane protein